MIFIKDLNLLLRFLLELCALASLGFWGFKAHAGVLLKLCFGIGIPILTAFIWGMFGSPKAAYKLPEVYQWLLIIFIYLLSAFALYSAKKPSLAIIFVVASAVNSILMFIWKQ